MTKAKVVSSDVCIVVIEEIKLNPLERAFTLLSVYQKPCNDTVISPTNIESKFTL
jgi:hypothetical protein